MARQFFKDLPDTSTPLTASRLNGLLDGEEPMGNLVVDSIRSKNIFNKANILNNTYLNISNQNKLVYDINSISGYAKCKPNTTYTISKIVSAPFIVATCSTTPAIDTTIQQGITNDSGSSITITTNSSAQYIVFWFYHAQYSTGSYNDIINSIQVEEGSTATSYSPYQNLTNSLDGYYETSNAKLYKMGDMVFSVVYTGSTAITNGTVATLPDGFKCDGTVRTFTRYYDGSSYQNGLLFVQGNKIQINTEFGAIPSSASFIRTVVFWKTTD